MSDLVDAARRLNDHPVGDMRSPSDVLARGRRYRRRRTIKMVSAAIVAAALSGATAAVAIGNSTHHPSITIVATVPSTVPAAAQRASNEADAVRVAAQSLDEIAVPAGAKRWAPAPPSVIATPAQYVAAQPSLMRYRIWSVAMSTGGALDFLRAHPPTGNVPFSSSGGIGSSSGPGEKTVRFLRYGGTLHDPAIAEVLLTISVVDDGPPRAWIRADVQVVYRPERPSDEYVSAHDAVVTISQTSMADVVDHRPPHATVVVTSPADVRRLRDAINDLPTLPERTVHCPALTGHEPEYVIAYQPSVNRAPDVVATTHDFCLASTRVSRHGHSRPLLEAGDLPTLAASLLQHHARHSR